ncbi:uncharacterized protein TRIADDRAFT_61453 [Trichoplax adhaerens]|uniref:Uncharacterized protein n=1 Tax=Trichoplax adhaerens TaxID=10228 RepID=B3SB11_TRIAD|nr:predicted protein [Trichoplax adhaerens]EDV20081.1 predicted protein [Trichoplax adhaerens]|eukprot:XP_002117465.1 predicted protein [Trichoplax adhaerens]
MGGINLMSILVVWGIYLTLSIKIADTAHNLNYKRLILKILSHIICKAKGMALQYLVTTYFTCMFVSCIHGFCYRKGHHIGNNGWWKLLYIIIRLVIPAVPMVIAYFSKSCIYSAIINVFGKEICGSQGTINLYFLIPLAIILTVYLIRSSLDKKWNRAKRTEETNI